MQVVADVGRLPVKTGQKYVGATGKKFLDDGVTIMNPILGQQDVGYFDSSEQLAMDGGPKVAWGIATQTIADGLSANLPQSNATAWAAGFKNDSFATVACPAWMIGQIQTNAGGHGTWDVADIPGGGGNWGGSWWSVPKQGKHTTEAAAFVKWLVQPAQQIAVFKKRRQPAVPARAVEGPGHCRLQEPEDQQRAHRSDLHRGRGQAARPAAVPRQEERRGAPGGGAGAHGHRTGQVQRRLRLDGRSQGGAEGQRRLSPNRVRRRVHARCRTPAVRPHNTDWNLP